MPDKTFEQVKSGFAPVRKVQKRLYKRNKNWLAVMTGPTGSGKSWTALRLAEEIDPDFNIDKVVLGLEEFMERLVNREWGQGDCVVFDEAGVSMSSKEFMTVTNRAMEDILETFRRQNIAVIFTAPSQYNVDKDVRRLLHGYLQTERIIKAKQRVRITWKRMQYNPAQDKTYYHMPRLDHGDKEEQIKVGKFDVGKPSQEILQDYEEKRDKYQEKLSRETLRTIKEKIDGDSGGGSGGKSTKKEIKEVSEENPDMSKEEIADKVDTSPKYVYQVLNGRI